MGTTGLELDKWCKKHNVAAFEGVFCSDTVPTPWRPRNFCAIVNHSPCDSPTGGTHWLGCRVQGRNATWFDSYGAGPHSWLENKYMGPRDPHPHFDDWLKAMGVTHVEHHDTDIQSLTSHVCGQYACWYAKYGLPSKNKRAWRWLSSNIKHNDAEIKNLVRVKP